MCFAVVDFMDQPACTRDVTVNLKEGLHMRPALKIAQVAQGFACDVRIHKDGRAIDAKNNLDLLTLFAEHGTVLTLEARGERADEAVNSLAKLFETNFMTEGQTPPAG